MNQIVKSGLNNYNVYAEVCEIELNVKDGISLEVVPTFNCYGIVFRPYNQTQGFLLTDYEMINSRQIRFNSGINLGDNIFIQYFLNQ